MLKENWLQIKNLKESFKVPYEASKLILLVLLGFWLAKASPSKATPIQPNPTESVPGDLIDNLPLSPEKFYITELPHERGAVVGIINLIDTSGKDPDNLCTTAPQATQFPNYHAPYPPFDIQIEGLPTKHTNESLGNTIRNLNIILRAIGLTSDTPSLLPQYTTLGNPLCINFNEEFGSSTQEINEGKQKSFHATFDGEYINNQILKIMEDRKSFSQEDINFYREFTQAPIQHTNLTRDQQITLENAKILEIQIINELNDKVNRINNSDEYTYFWDLLEAVKEHQVFKRSDPENIIIQLHIPKNKFPPGIIGLNPSNSKINFVAQERIHNPNLGTHEILHDVQWFHIDGNLQIYNFIMDPIVYNSTQFNIVSGPNLDTSILFAYLNDMPEWALERLISNPIFVGYDNSTTNEIIKNMESVISGHDSGEATNRIPKVEDVTLQKAQEGVQVQIKFDQSKLNSVTSNVMARVAIPATAEKKIGLSHEFPKIDKFYNSLEVIMSNDVFSATQEGLLSIKLPEEFMNPNQQIYIIVDLGGRQVTYKLEYPETFYDVEMVDKNKVIDPSLPNSGREIPSFHTTTNLEHISFGSLNKLMSSIQPGETVIFKDSEMNTFSCSIDLSRSSIVVCNEFGEKIYFPFINKSEPDTSEAEASTAEKVSFIRKDTYTDETNRPKPSTAFREAQRGQRNHI